MAKIESCSIVWAADVRAMRAADWSARKLTVRAGLRSASFAVPAPSNVFAIGDAAAMSSRSQRAPYATMLQRSAACRPDVRLGHISGARMLRRALVRKRRTAVRIRRIAFVALSAALL